MLRLGCPVVARQRGRCLTRGGCAPVLTITRACPSDPLPVGRDALAGQLLAPHAVPIFPASLEIFPLGYIILAWPDRRPPPTPSTPSLNPGGGRSSTCS